MSTDQSEQCNFIVPKKKRRCKMTIKKGQEYCKEHSICAEGSNRIPCPKDPKHTVDAAQLEEHLKKCNARLGDEPYIRENFNIPPGKIDREFLRPSEEAISDVIELIQRAYPRIKDQIKELGYQQMFEEKMQTEVTNQKKIGHLIQLGSIIDHLQAHNLLKNSSDSCLIDLGSGRAQLIYWLAKEAPNCRYLLVDKVGARHKFENKASKDDSTLKINRIRCSIENLDLSQVPVVRECNTSITAVCKHFCGNALDTGIRCVENAIQQGIKFNGFVFAACCHHRCTFSEYTGNNYLQEIGIKTAEEFAALRHVSTWALCCFPKTESEEDTKTNAQKLELGRQAKRILEYGRACHLSKFGYTVELFKYVDFEVSPENLLIVGYWPKAAKQNE